LKIRCKTSTNPPRSDDPTHPWQTRGERLGEISLVLIGFTIPLSNALCTGAFPALAVVAWLMLCGWRNVPKLMRENRVARGDYIVLLDGDRVPHRRFIADHSQLAE